MTAGQGVKLQSYRGSNEIRFNQATMIDAVQEYIDKRTAQAYESPVVRKVSMCRDHGLDGFTVLLQEREGETE